MANKHPIQPKQILGIARADRLRTAALLFDRVWCDPLTMGQLGMPPSIGFSHGPAEDEVKSGMESALNWMLLAQATREATPEARQRVALSFERMVSAVYSRHGIGNVLLYPAETALNVDFHGGADVAYQAAMSFVPLAIDSELSWEHVIQFRQDKESIENYRAFRHWLRDSVHASSLGEAIDIIGGKLDKYERALKKHGITTHMGILGSLVTSDYLVALTSGVGLSALLSGPVWAALAGGAITVAKVALFVAERNLALDDIKHGEHSEVALVHELRKRFGDKAHNKSSGGDGR